MTAPHASQIIDGYLARLESETSDLPRAQRGELLDSIREHIEEARASLPSETDAGLLNILDRLGDPAELAEEERERLDIQPAQPTRAGLIEVGALILTPLFWPVGVILLWASSAWNWRDKLIGTLVPPGGFAGVLMLGLGAFGTVHTVGCGTTYDTAGHLIRNTCSSVPHSSPILQALGLILFLLVLLSPILTGIYLAIRLHHRSRAMLRPAPAL